MTISPEAEFGFFGGHRVDILQKGLKLFKDKDCDMAIEELDQLHRGMCFTPVDVNDLTRTEKKKALEALMLLTEKKDKTVKGLQWEAIM